MTARDKLERMIAVMLGIMGMISTGGLIYLTLVGQALPPSLVGVAMGIVGALGGALSISSAKERRANGKEATSTANPTDDLHTRR